MIHQQSVFEPWAIESESVQAVICSPPYYALRKYSIPDIIIGGDKDCKHEFYEEQFKTKNQINFSNSGLKNDGRKEINRISTNEKSKFNHQENVYHAGFCIHCNAWKGQYGLEPRPTDYVEHTRLWAKEAWRVLRKDGVFFLNIADSYNSQPIGRQVDPKRMSSNGEYSYNHKKPFLKDYPSKCQLLIPHRVAIGLVDDGWILRNTIIWHKSNAMPESVTDRFSKKYEYIFMFTKQEKYYFDLDSILEPYTESSLKRYNLAQGRNLESVGITKGFDSGCSDTNENYPQIYKTGQGSVKARGNNKDSLVVGGNNGGKNPGDVWIIPTSPSSEKHFAMWPEILVERMIKCSTRGPREINGDLLIDAVLDPFCGSGTTLKVASQLCREPLGIDLGYHEMSKRRTSKIQKEMFI